MAPRPQGPWGTAQPSGPGPPGPAPGAAAIVTWHPSDDEGRIGDTTRSSDRAPSRPMRLWHARHRHPAGPPARVGVCRPGRRRPNGDRTGPARDRELHGALELQRPVRALSRRQRDRPCWRHHHPRRRRRSATDCARAVCRGPGTLAAGTMPSPAGRPRCSSSTTNRSPRLRGTHQARPSGATARTRRSASGIWPLGASRPSRSSS